MKKHILVLAILSILSSPSFSQKKTIYISTKLPITYRVYIDNQLQFFGDVVRIKLFNVPIGEKKMHVRIMTPSNQKPSVLIAINSDREEYYTIIQEGDNYSLKFNLAGAKDDKATYTRGSFVPVQKPFMKDTSKRDFHTCKMTDSAINKLILDLNNLKDVKSKKNFVVNYMKRKCLYTDQIKSIGYRIDDDMTRLELYQNLFLSSLDRNNFAKLTNSFQSQLYGNKFIDWFTQQKL